MQNPRTRLVSLRMTDEEYDRLRQASEEDGARSVSDFARKILLASSAAGSPYGCGCEYLSFMQERMVRVEQEVAQVRNEVRTQASRCQGS